MVALCNVCVFDVQTKPIDNPIWYMEPDKMIDAICSLYNIKHADLKCEDRFSELVKARRLCSYLMWKYSDIAQSGIANVFNQKHSNISIHIKKAESQYELYDSIRNEYDMVQNVLLLKKIISHVIPNGKRLKKAVKRMYAKWDSEEIALLIRNYKTLTTNEMGMLLNRDASSVRNKLNAIGLSATACRAQ